MKRISNVFVAGMLAGGVFAEGVPAGKELQLVKATDRQVELHGHEHAVAGELPLDAPVEKSKSPNLPYGLEYGALFEVETAHSDGRTETVMATIELGAGWQVTDWLHGDVVFLYEEGDTDPMDLDQLFFTLGDTGAFPLYLQGGKFYAPFGHFDSFFISDPIVLELAEGLEDGATLGFEKGGFDAALTVFNSDVSGSDVYNGILAASYGVEGEDASIAFGAALIRNILDADGLTGVLEDAAYTSADEAAGFNAWLTATQGEVTLIAEYVQTLQDIEIDGSDTGMKPASLNLELGYAVTERIDVAAKLERGEDVADWFAETRYGVVGSCTVLEHDLVTTGIAFEYLREEFVDGSEGDLFTMQFAVEF